MSKEKYQALLAKYLNGECSDEERALLDQWYEALRSDGKKDIDLESTASFLERNWAALVPKIHPEPEQVKPLFQWWRWIAAASLVLAISASYFLGNKWWTVSSSAQSTALTESGLRKTNFSPRPQTITLPDGSTVVLEKNASLITARDFGKQQRAVYLQGGAFFSVKPNAKLPFLVHAGDVVTEVLGTSFRIQALANNRDIEVSVNTGRVSVYTLEKDKVKKRNGVILTPNQKAIISTELKTIQQGIVERPTLVDKGIPESSFIFEETTFDQVLKSIQNAYGIEIVVVNPAVKVCAFTGDLNGLELFPQLELLCGTINAKFETRGTAIFILGKGCD
ncbi:MAG: FecR family protein [Haliscomenobacter sp.]|nr:FecR family protein [Haliscomenobacter sp.]MBK9492386.1 FecR family protein [Haliscomenobacter sp.]